ncbi:MAG TPA: hypothetical protein VFC12_03770 [Terriglobales bacterium]|nr:hypothetical protein [Terriglobales bacterium]
MTHPAPQLVVALDRVGAGVGVGANPTVHLPATHLKAAHLLDLLAHKTCVEHDFLLDPAYEDLLSDEECAPRDLIQPLVARVQGRRGPVASRVKAALMDFGDESG